MSDDLERWKKLAQNEMKTSDLSALSWQTSEGFSLKAVYHLSDLDPEIHHRSLPGLYPYTRGIKAAMYARRPWTIPQSAHFSTAEANNAFFHSCLNDGQKILSVAFDLATHRGYDSDHPSVEGDVGKAGVALDTVEDMKRLFSQIPLDIVNVSMAMNGAVLPILAFYIVAAEEGGFFLKDLSGTLQNDILKEFLVCNTLLYPPEASMRIVSDVMVYACEKMPNFNPLSISGYPLHKAGATAAQELAYTLTNGLEYVRTSLGLGMDIDVFAPRLSFFFGIGMNFFMEIAKLRAARTLWAELIQQFSPKKPESAFLQTHCQTSGASLTDQDPHHNIVRTTVEALAAVLGGTQSLQTHSLNQALSLSTPDSTRIAHHTHLILAEETYITNAIDPLAGSYYVETLTQELIESAKILILEIEEKGGIIKAIEQGIPQINIEQAAILRQIRLDTQQDIIVGANKYGSLNQECSPMMDSHTDFVRDQQITQLQLTKATRSKAACQTALSALKEVATTGQGNLLEATVEAARCRATLGEISGVLEDVFGRYQPPLKPITGVWLRAMEGREDFQNIREKSTHLAAFMGEAPRILVVKSGQDGHSIQIMASSFADCGFEVSLAPLFLSPEEAAKQAVEKDVHIIGISSLAAGHKTWILQLIQALKDCQAVDIKIVCEGILASQDHPLLKEAGINLIFTPDLKTLEMIDRTLDLLIEPFLPNPTNE